MTRQEEKADRFRALHAGEAFVIPNPWDTGSARVLAALGFEALATTSSGFAFTLGRLDGNVTLDEVIEHTTALDHATDLPISVDLENGYGPEPEDAALAITRAAEAGAVGGSIEDYDPGGFLYELDHAVERVAAAVEAARGLGFPFVLTARAENHIRGNPDLQDTIARLRGGGYSLDGVREVVEAAFGIPVLDRAADGARLGDAGDGQGGLLRAVAVAVLEVDRDRELRRVA